MEKKTKERGEWRVKGKGSEYLRKKEKETQT